MGEAFWNQVQHDTESLVGTGEISIPFLLINGEESFQGSGIFENSYRELDIENQVPVASKYIVLRLCESGIPIAVRTGMQLLIGEKLYEIAGIREPGSDGITTLELRI